MTFAEDTAWGTPSSIEHNIKQAREEKLKTIFKNYTSQPHVVALLINEAEDMPEELFYLAYEKYSTSANVLGHLLLKKECPWDIILKEHYIHPSLRRRTATRVKLFHRQWRKTHVDFLLSYYPEVNENMKMEWLELLTEPLLPQREEDLTA